MKGRKVEENKERRLKHFGGQDSSHGEKTLCSVAYRIKINFMGYTTRNKLLSEHDGMEGACRMNKVFQGVTCRAV
jgi:hypothetical protein